MKRGSSQADRDEELSALGFTKLECRIISVRNLKRKGEKVDSAYCTISLLGSEEYDTGKYRSYVRSGKSDFTVLFDEKFELAPLKSLSQAISIKIFDKKFSSIVTGDKLIVEHTIPDLRDEKLVGRNAEAINWVELSSTGLFEDTGDIRIAFALKP